MSRKLAFCRDDYFDKPVSYLLKTFLPKVSPARDALLRDVKKQWYYRDYCEIAGKTLDMKDVDEYIRQSFRVTDRGGLPQFYLRQRKTECVDEWIKCDTQFPFTREWHRPTFYHMVDVEVEDPGCPGQMVKI